MPSKTVLLIGATGFVGSHLLERLLKKGYKVVCASRETSDLWRIKHFIEHHPNIEFFQFNNIQRDVSLCFRRHNIDCVIHCATHYSKEENYGNCKETIESNINFPIKLLNLAIEHNVPYFINTGSGFQDSKPDLIYSQSKSIFETILKKAVEAQRIKALTLQLYSPYGPKDNAKVLPFIIKKALKKELIHLTSPYERLEFTYIEDIVDAYMLALNEIPNVTQYENIQILSFPDATLQQVVNKICTQTEGEFEHFYPKNILDWKPKHTFEQGLKKTIAWYKKNV